MEVELPMEIGVNRFSGWCVLLLVCVGVLFPFNARAATLLGLRAATHPGYTRLVAQLDEAAVYELHSASEDEWILELHATQPGPRVQPPQFKRSSRIASIRLEAGQDRARLRINTRRYLQPTIFALTGPYRVVLDFRPVPSPTPAPSVESEFRAEITESAAPVGVTTPTAQETDQTVPASGPAELSTIQGTVEEDGPISEIGSESITEDTVIQEPHDAPNDSTTSAPPTLELGSTSPTDADGVSGWALLQWLLYLLLVVGVVFLWLQNRQLRAELDSRRSEESAVGSERPDSPTAAGIHASQRRTRRSSRRRSLLRSWRVRRWLNFHYRDLFFFFVLLLIVVLVILSM